MLSDQKQKLCGVQLLRPSTYLRIFLSWDLWVPVATLSYSIYIFHVYVITSLTLLGWISIPDEMCSYDGVCLKSGIFERDGVKYSSTSTESCQFWTGAALKYNF
jgi:hypothetical protein